MSKRGEVLNWLDDQKNLLGSWAFERAKAAIREEMKAHAPVGIRCRACAAVVGRGEDCPAVLRFHFMLVGPAGTIGAQSNPEPIQEDNE